MKIREIKYHFKKNISKVLVGSIFMLFSLQATSQNGIDFENYSLNDGLSQNTVSSIIQDNKGFLWFGTEDGLNKFDGYGFNVYKPILSDTNSLSNLQINVVFEDSKGFLWIGTINGLNKFDPQKEIFTRYLHDDKNESSISNDYIKSICEDKKGNIWIGTFNGLNFLNTSTNKITRYLHEEGNANSVNHSSVKSLAIDNEGAIWIGTAGGGLSKLTIINEKETFLHFKNDPQNPKSLSNDIVYTVFIDNENILWAVTAGGVLNKMVKKTDGSYTFIHYIIESNASLDLDSHDLYPILQDKTGALWIGTEGQGLKKLISINNEVSIINYINNPENSSSLSSNVIRSIFEDNAGTLWIGTRGNGVDKANLQKKKFAHYKLATYLPKELINDNIYTILEDEKDVLWIGTNGRGLVRLNRVTGQYTHFTYKKGDCSSLPNNKVRRIYKDSNGTIWIGSYGGLSKYNKEEKNFTNYIHDVNDSTSLGYNIVLHMAEDKNKNLWIGTGGGGIDMIMAKDKLSSSPLFTHYKHNPDNLKSIISDDVSSLHFDRHENLWIGTNLGLCVFNSKKEVFKIYQYSSTNVNTISGNNINDICEDSSGTIWIGTFGRGFNKLVLAKDNDTLKEDTFVRYSEKDGLANNVTYCLLLDNNNHLWMSTNNGLSRFDPQKNQFRNYDITDGLQSKEFNSNAAFKNTNGEMFFGGINGFNSFFPDSIKENTYKPPVYITNIKINNKKVTIGKQKDDRVILTKSICKTKEITLNHTDRFLRFDFVALNYIGTEKNTYAYKMEGFDKEWIETKEYRFATYTNLPSGRYTFKVIASNNDGVWNRKGASLRIIMLPPWWETWWFRILVAIIIFGSIAILYFQRLNRIKKQNLKLEKQVKERTEEIGQQNEEILGKNTELKVQQEEILTQNEEIRSINEEVLAQKDYLEEVNKELEKLSIVASKTDSAVIIMDEEGNFEWINEGFTRMFGYTLSELIFNQGRNIIGESTPKEIKEAVLHCLNNKTSVSYELHAPTKSEKKVWIYVTLTPILSEKGKLKKIVAIDTDISKVKEAEKELERKNKQITDSINYAKLIQESILPNKNVLKPHFKNTFILYQPRDIVSGDFYWFSKQKNKLFFAVVDCTGHGVPGAFMSMIGNSQLNHIVNEEKTYTPSDILDNLNKKVIEALNQHGEESNGDGMDMSLCSFDLENNEIEFAGANLPLYIINDNKLDIIDGDIYSIGGIFAKKDGKKFVNHKIKAQDGMSIFMFSDGYADQFNQSDSKFGIKNFKNLLLNSSHLSMDEIHTHLLNSFIKWKGDENQTDDVCVAGIKVSSKI